MKTSPSKKQKEGKCYRGSHVWNDVHKKKRGTEEKLKGKERMKRFHRKSSGSLVLNSQPWCLSSGQSKEREQGNEKKMNYTEKEERRTTSTLEREDRRDKSDVILSRAIGRYCWQRGDRDKKGYRSSGSSRCCEVNGSRKETSYEEENRKERENRTLFFSTCPQVKMMTIASVARALHTFLLIFSLSFSSLTSLFFIFLSISFLASPHRHLSHSSMPYDTVNPSTTLRVSPSAFLSQLSFLSFASAALVSVTVSPSSFIFSSSISPLSLGEIPVSLISTQTLPRIILATALPRDKTSFSSSPPVDFSYPSFRIHTPSEDLRLSALSLSSHLESEASRLSEKATSIPQGLSFKPDMADTRERGVAREEIDGKVEDYDGEIQVHKETRMHDESTATRRLPSEKETPQIRRVERKRLQRDGKKREVKTMEEKSQGPFSSLLRGKMEKETTQDIQTSLHGDKREIFNTKNPNTTIDSEDIHSNASSSTSSLPSSSSSSSPTLFPPPPRSLSSSSFFPTPPEKDALPETSLDQKKNPTAPSSVISSSSPHRSPPPVSSSSSFAAGHSSSSPYSISSTQTEKPPVKKRRLVQFKKKADTVVLAKSLPSSAGHTARNLDTMNEKTGSSASHSGDIRDEDENAEEVIERPLKGSPSSGSSLSLGGGVGGGVYHREHTGATRPWIWALSSVFCLFCLLVLLVHRIKLRRVAVYLQSKTNSCFPPPVVYAYGRLFTFFPLSAFCGWLSLLFPQLSLLCRVLLHLYEVACLHWFWALLLDLLGGPDRALHILNALPSSSSSPEKRIMDFFRKRVKNKQETSNKKVTSPSLEFSSSSASLPSAPPPRSSKAEQLHEKTPSRLARRSLHFSSACSGLYSSVDAPASIQAKDNCYMSSSSCASSSRADLHHPHISTEDREEHGRTRSSGIRKNDKNLERTDCESDGGAPRRHREKEGERRARHGFHGESSEFQDDGGREERRKKGRRGRKLIQLLLLVPLTSRPDEDTKKSLRGKKNDEKKRDHPWSSTEGACGDRSNNVDQSTVSSLEENEEEMKHKKYTKKEKMNKPQESRRENDPAGNRGEEERKKKILLLGVERTAGGDQEEEEGRRRQSEDERVRSQQGEKSEDQRRYIIEEQRNQIEKNQREEEWKEEKEGLLLKKTKTMSDDTTDETSSESLLKEKKRESNEKQEREEEEPFRGREEETEEKSDDSKHVVVMIGREGGGEEKERKEGDEQSEEEEESSREDEKKNLSTVAIRNHLSPSDVPVVVSCEEEKSQKRSKKIQDCRERKACEERHLLEKTAIGSPIEENSRGERVCVTGRIRKEGERKEEEGRGKRREEKEQHEEDLVAVEVSHGGEGENTIMKEKEETEKKIPSGIPQHVEDVRSSNPMNIELSKHMTQDLHLPPLVSSSSSSSPASRFLPLLPHLMNTPAASQDERRHFYPSRDFLVTAVKPQQPQQEDGGNLPEFSSLSSPIPVKKGGTERERMKKDASRPKEETSEEKKKEKRDLKAGEDGAILNSEERGDRKMYTKSKNWSSYGHPEQEDSSCEGGEREREKTGCKFFDLCADEDEDAEEREEKRVKRQKGEEEEEEQEEDFYGDDLHAQQLGQTSSSHLLRRIWCVPPLCCFAWRSKRRELNARDIRLSYLCLLPYTFLSCAVTVLSSLVPSTLFIVPSPSSSSSISSNSRFVSPSPLIPAHCSGEETLSPAAQAHCDALRAAYENQQEVKALEGLKGTELTVDKAASGGGGGGGAWVTSSVMEVAFQETLQQAAVFSLMLAMWGIGVIYFASRHALKGFRLGIKFTCIKILVLVIQVSEIAAKFRKGALPFSPSPSQASTSHAPSPLDEVEEEFLEIHHSLFDFIITAIAVPMTFLAMRTFDPEELRRLAVVDPASASLDTLLTAGSKDPDVWIQEKKSRVRSLCPVPFSRCCCRRRREIKHAVHTNREAEEQLPRP